MAITKNPIMYENGKNITPKNIPIKNCAKFISWMVLPIAPLTVND
ncbi:unnamed protein product, partial [marine sediment metagenome]